MVDHQPFSRNSARSSSTKLATQSRNSGSRASSGSGSSSPVAATLDGFELSRVDLEQRREGDVLGAAQSGRKSSLKLLQLLRD
ncbi:MAG TPA: hypothetical protein VHA75_10725, partial [Rugosimonospora sp.]|nr:hypothetical protein [Rugosimonospora sp.]